MDIAGLKNKALKNAEAKQSTNKYPDTLNTSPITTEKEAIDYSEYIDKIPSADEVERRMLERYKNDEHLDDDDDDDDDDKLWDDDDYIESKQKTSLTRQKDEEDNKDDMYLVDDEDDADEYDEDEYDDDDDEVSFFNDVVLKNSNKILVVLGIIAVVILAIGVASFIVFSVFSKSNSKEQSQGDNISASDNTSTNTSNNTSANISTNTSNNTVIVTETPKTSYNDTLNHSSEIYTDYMKVSKSIEINGKVVECYFSGFTESNNTPLKFQVPADIYNQVKESDKVAINYSIAKFGGAVCFTNIKVEPLTS